MKRFLVCTGYMLLTFCVIFLLFHLLPVPDHLSVSLGIGISIGIGYMLFYESNKSQKKKRKK